jgi:hypothetical protein
VRKVILWMQQTADGYTEGPNGEFDWSVLPETNRYFNAKARELESPSRPAPRGHRLEPGVVLTHHERVR